MFVPALPYYLQQLIEVAAAAGPVELIPAVGNCISARAMIGWTTLGHTGCQANTFQLNQFFSGVDVNLYAYGIEANKLRGNYDNTAVGQFVEDTFGFNLQQVTNSLT